MPNARLGASGVGRVGHSCRNRTRGHCRTASIRQRAYRAARDAETSASGLASQHHRLDRHWGLADCRALARLAGRASLDHFSGCRRVRVCRHRERRGQSRAARGMGLNELCCCAGANGLLARRQSPSSFSQNRWLHVPLHGLLMTDMGARRSIEWQVRASECDRRNQRMRQHALAKMLSGMDGVGSFCSISGSGYRRRTVWLAADERVRIARQGRLQAPKRSRVSILGAARRASATATIRCAKARSSCVRKSNKSCNEPSDLCFRTEVPDKTNVEPTRRLRAQADR